MRHVGERRGLSALVALALLLAPGLAMAQAGLEAALPGATSAPQEDPTSPQAIADRRSEVDAALAALAAEPPAGSPAHVEARRERLQALADLQDEALRLVQQAEAKAAAASRATADAPIVASPFALNALYEALEAERRRIAEGAQQVEQAREALERAKAKLEQAGKRRRKAKTAITQAPGAPDRSALETLALRELDERVAAETVHLRMLETRAAVAQRDDDQRLPAIEARIEATREALARGEPGSDAGFAALVAAEGEQRRLGEALERRLATADLQLEAAQKRFADDRTPSPEMLAQVEALRGTRDALRQELNLVGRRVERLSAQAQMWRRWDEVLRGDAGRETLTVWEDEVAAHLAALEDEALDRVGRAADLARRIEYGEEQLAEAREGSALQAALAEHLTRLRALHDQVAIEADALAADRRMGQRLLADLRGGADVFAPEELWNAASEGVQDTWSYEITSVDDAPITVGSLVLALVIFAAGMWVSRRGAEALARVVGERFGLDAGAAHALQTLSFYTLLVSFSLLALRAVHFPLTAFTVLGGALAIGIGFGSQNVMNNFISGLILMLERPVRARDVVEVDGNHGTIEKIGARSTQIRSTDGRHLIVPNSFFLETNVVNWTLSDELIRARVRVGVVYGSPTRLVEELIQRAVAEEPDALDHPTPIVVFEDFGDNSLNFDVYFWVRARAPMAVRRVQSRVRFAIDDLFREHALVIAFPQRDVHLDTAAPLEVRVLAANDPSTAPTASGSDGD